MVYKWTMAMQLSLEYCIDPKDHKSEEEYKAVALKGAIYQSSHQMLRLAGSALQDGGVPPKH